MKRRLASPGLLLAATLAAEAGRPLTVDDAAPVAPGFFEAEGGVSYAQDASTHHWDFPLGLTYGMPARVEIGLGFGGQLEEREESPHAWETHSGWGDLTLGAKWNPLAEDRCWASQALAFTVKLPTADHHSGLGSGETDYDFTYILSKNVTPKWSAHLNAGYTITGDTSDAIGDDLFHGGLAVGYRVAERVELVGEVFADVPVTATADSAVACNCGARWNLWDNLTLDAAAGCGLRGDAPDLTATAGFTWTFGPD